jgi:hypothetical protein
MESTPAERTCPTCGRRYALSLDICPHCGRDSANPFVSPVAVPTARCIEWRWIVPVALCMCALAALLAFVAPGLSVLLLVVASPILARAWAVVERRREAGLPVSRGERVRAVLLSTGFVLLAGIASTVAFTAVCFPVGLPFFSLYPDRLTPRQAQINQIGTIIAFASGACAGIAVGCYVLRRYWPKKVERLE